MPSTQPPRPADQPRPPDQAAPPPIRALDPPMVPFAVGGMVAWAVAGLILLGFRPTLVAHGHEEWLSICLAGFLLGLPGLALMLRHDANRRRRRAQAGQGR